jgi:hypothetical protein
MIINKEQTMVEHSKAAGDWISLGATVGAVAGWLPSIAALASLIYTAMRIYEWIEIRRMKKEMTNERPSTTL